MSLSNDMMNSKVVAGTPALCVLRILRSVLSPQEILLDLASLALGEAH